MMSRRPFCILILILLIGLVLAMVVAAGIGAMSISPANIVAIIAGEMGWGSFGNYSETESMVVMNIRLPRIICAVLVGGALGLSGALLQGLFRNPLADPGLIGISAGASFSAALVIVLGASAGLAGYYTLPLFTFIGALATTFLVYALSRSGNRTIVTTMLLAGVAINALAAAGTGFLTYISDESQLRTLSFWLLGGLGGSNWSSVLALLPFVLIPLYFLKGLSKKLNAFALGEEDAAYLGIRTGQLKTLVILLSTLAVGASVAMAGVIGFVGLVVPHIVRLMFGPDHRIVLPASMIVGGILLLVADTLCRTVIAPEELPAGIITAVLGTPLFLSILLREKKKNGMAWA